MRSARWVLVALAAAVAAGGLYSVHAAGRPPIPPPVSLGHTSPEAYTGPGAYTQIACSEEMLAAARVYYSGELLVYRVTKRPPTREDTLRLAQRLGVEVTPEVRARMPGRAEGDTYATQLGPWQITFGDDGRYAISNPSVQVTRDRVGPRISDAIAKAAADGFLRRTRLLPDACRYGGVMTRAAHTVNLPDGRIAESVDIVAVQYVRYLSDLPDGAFAVDVTADGEVCGVSSRAPRVTPASRYPAITPEEALAAFRAGEVEMLGPGGRVGERGHRLYRAEVESMYIAYSGAAPATATVSYLHPMYVIQARVVDGSGRLLPERLTGSVPAVSAEYLDESLLYSPR